MTEHPTVAFLTFDWSYGAKEVQPNGCAWYRCMLPMIQLREAGFDTMIGMPGWNDNHGFGLLMPDQTAIHGWDVIVFKLIMLGTVAEKMDEAHARGQKVAVDIDDWFEGLEESNLAHRLTSAAVNPRSNRDFYMEIINKADALITSTPFLYDFYKNKGHKNVFLVRNGIDSFRWRQRKDHSRWLPTVGWVGATPWRSRDLESVSHVIPNFIVDNRLSFHHSGHTPGAAWAWKQIGLDEKHKGTHEGMRQIIEYPEMFRKIDLGLVPLSDVGFNHAKSSIKGLEYAAAGVPFVASGTPEYRLLAESGVGRVANTDSEWLSQLSELLDPRIRKEEVEKNLANLEQHTMEARRQDWVDVMHKISQL